MLATTIMILMALSAGAEPPGDPLSALRRQVELIPDSATAHYDLARALDLRGEWESAAAGYEKTLAIQPEHGPARRRLAQMLTDHGQCDRASSIWGAIQMADANDTDAQLGLAHCAMQAGEYPAALSRFRTAAESSPRNPAIHRGMGVCLLKSESFDEARETFQKAAELDPDNMATALALAHLALGLGRLDEAGPAIDRYSWLARNTKDGPANTQLLGALLEALQHQTILAAEHLAQHRKRHPDHAVETLYLLARLNYEAMHYDTALGQFQKLHAATPDDAEVSFYLAALAAREDREEEARALMEKALQQGFARPEAFLDNSFDPVKESGWFKDLVPPVPQTFYDPAPSPEEEEDEAKNDPDAAGQRERIWRSSEAWIETWIKEWALESIKP